MQCHLYPNSTIFLEIEDQLSILERGLNRGGGGGLLRYINFEARCVSAYQEKVIDFIVL